jgi:3-oxoacyl-[acyl-carrier-protein] synthase-1
MGALRQPLYVAGAGAVTPAGLTAPQTCAAIRAGLSAFEEYSRPEPIGAVQLVARVPAHRRLRRTEGEWLVNMAARAIAEAQEGGDAGGTAVFLTPPESFRGHPAYEDISPARFLAEVLAATGLGFHRASRAFDGGPAAAVGILGHAREVMEREGIAEILLGGVDSLINAADLGRLGQAHRLKSDTNAQGLVPGEAAVVVRLTRNPDRAAKAAIVAVGAAQEADTVASERYSQGRGLLAALRAAVEGPGPSEPDIDFVVSNGNGERYQGWEAMIARPRFYRTRREILPTAYPAMTVGEVGSAGAALALMLAADSFAEGYAPGRLAMCEIASEGGLRAAAVASAIR